MQVILYAGGIMVLFVFVIMLVNLDVALHQVQFNRQWFVALIVCRWCWAAQVAVALVGEPRERCTRMAPAPPRDARAEYRAAWLVPVPHLHAAV